MSSILKPVLGSQLQIGHSLSQGLVGCWLMNEGSGNKVFDLSGNGNTGTLVSDVTWTSEKFGSALSFPGTNDWVNVGNGLSLDIQTGEMTLVVWCKLTSANRLVLGKRDGGGTSYQFYLAADGSMSYYDGANDRNDGTALGNGVWHMMVWVVGGGTVKFYPNGFFSSSAVAVVGTGASNAAVYIGSMVLAASEFQGTMDNVSIYNRALSASEIALLYREPFCMFQRDLIELWVGATSVGAPPVGNVGIMTTNAGYWGPTF